MINGNTLVYGIIGQPVRHTLSPAMQNAAFAHLGVNAVYLAFPVDEIADAARGIRALGLAGVSVTIPFKQTVMPFLDQIDPVALKIGAINTIVVEETPTRRRLLGYNTDWLGANRALQEVVDLPGKRAVVVGSGGSARAIGFGLIEAGVQVSICSRNPASGQKLAADLGCQWFALQDANQLRADILVHATPVGMAPNSSEALLSQETLTGYQVVMDIVYSPLRTGLVQNAEAAGCRIVHGVEMLLYQGVAQCELWTRQQAPVELMRAAMLAGLGLKQA